MKRISTSGLREKYQAQEAAPPVHTLPERLLPPLLPTPKFKAHSTHTLLMTLSQHPHVTSPRGRHLGTLRSPTATRTPLPFLVRPFCINRLPPARRTLHMSTKHQYTVFFSRRQEKRDPLLRDFGDFGTSPDPASAGSRVHAWIRLAQIPITGHRP